MNGDLQYSTPILYKDTVFTNPYHSLSMRGIAIRIGKFFVFLIFISMQLSKKLASDSMYSHIEAKVSFFLLYISMLL